MYKLELSRKTYNVDFGEEFGKFTIRMLGAGEELELNSMVRELEKTAESLKDLEEKKDADFTEADKKRMRNASDLAFKNRVRTIEIFKGVFTSEDKDAVDKLFNQLDIATIRNVYDEVVNNG